MTYSTWRSLAVIAALLLTACGESSSSGGISLATACASHDGEGLNRQAIALSSSASPDNACMELHQYNLFAPNPDTGFERGDPRRPLVVDGEYQGLPYGLNTALFTDYTTKHRIVFLPKDDNGAFIPATYRDAGSSPDGEPGTGDLGKANDNFLFPVGTVIAKTFTYPDTSAPGGPVERLIETRLLIKHRNTDDGSASWEGVAYIWEQDELTGEWIARRQNLGGWFSEARQWHYPDPNDPGLTVAGQADEGERPYLIPSRNDCRVCHVNPDQDAGTAPIGLKARHLNRPYASEFAEFTNDPAGLTDTNQIDYWAAQGWLIDVEPQAYTLDNTTGVITDIERIQPYNLPGDGDNIEADLDARARGYLEANCVHCHNQARGGTKGFYMEFQRPLCSGNLIGMNNINPGNDDNPGGLHSRISAQGSEYFAMPRIGREQIHAEGVALIRQWIVNMDPGICDH